MVAYEISPGPDRVLVELNLFKQTIEQRNKGVKVSADILQKTQPRLMSFSPLSSIQQIKEHIFEYYSSVFGTGADVESCIELQVSCNLPTVTLGKYNARQKAVCEFCKERHDNLTQFCELEILGLDTRSPSVASKVLLQNVLD